MSLYQRVAPFIQTGDSMPLGLVADLFMWVEQQRNDEIQRKAVEEIAPDIASLLPSFALDRFIAAEITLTEAKTMASSRKALISRSAALLPSMFRLFEVSNDNSLFSVTSRILDSAEAFPLIESSPHQKRAKREAREVANEVLQLTISLIKKLGEFDLIDSSGFIQQVEAEEKLSRIDAISEVDTFNRRLEILAFAVKSTLVRDQLGEEVFLIGHNMTHTHIVRAAYEVAHWNGKPKFSTTPGSDFALVCSLFFELATGVVDVSMAGAINKLARSDWRQRFDRDEAEYQLEYLDVDDSAAMDNFHFKKFEAKRCADEAIKWLKLVESSDWSDSDILHINRRTTFYLENVTSLLSETGPFILWASQMPQIERHESHLELQALESELLDLRIKLGKLRRSKAIS